MTPLLTKIWFFYVLSPFSVGAWMEHYEVRYKGVVMEQAMLESMWLNCDNCGLSLNQNIFGFTTNEMMVFDNWIESIKFYSDYQKKYLPDYVCTEEEYYRWLIKNWNAPNMNDYIRKLKQIRVLINNPK